MHCKNGMTAIHRFVFPRALCDISQFKPPAEADSPNFY